MFSRRRFFGMAAAAGASSLVHAQDQTKCSSLPPSIAQLTSMSSQAEPISAEEREQRQEEARRLMTGNHLDAILIGPGTSLKYFSGIDWWGSERLFAMVLPVKGQMFYVSAAFEEGRARERLARDGKTADIRVWQEHENPYNVVAQGLKDRGIATGTVGLEETLKFVFSDGIKKAASRANFVSATPVTAGCRGIKSQHELDLMRLANQVTLAAYAAVYRSVAPGMTQSEVEHLLDAAHRQLGFPGEVEVQIGEFAAFPHGSLTPQIVREGTVVLMDGGCKVEGYQSDITRTFVLGKASEKMNQVFEIVHRAQSAALQAARPGAQAQSVDAAARKVITDSGYGPDYKYFTHRLGHGIGMDEHEWPYLVRGNTMKLEPNMTFSDEPGIYIRGEFGIRLEDDMHITEDGAQLFTPQSPSLEDPFGKA
jgi:Xaa-Pro dipeptidase